MFKENSFETNKTPGEKALEKLFQLADKLEDLGFTPIRRSFTINNINNEMPFPLVEEGLNGARVEFDVFEGLLKLWFTNGFDDPDNESRKKIQSAWDDSMSK